MFIFKHNMKYLDQCKSILWDFKDLLLEIEYINLREKRLDINEKISCRVRYCDFFTPRYHRILHFYAFKSLILKDLESKIILKKYPE